MCPRSISILLTAALGVTPRAWSQSPADSLLGGITAVEAGDFEKGLLTLDAFVRSSDVRVAQSRPDLSRAHFYLGVAYVGLLQETPARHHFREALKLDPQLTADPARFPPRVVRVFVAAQKNRTKPALYAGAGLGSAALVGAVLAGGSAAAVAGGVIPLPSPPPPFSDSISVAGPNFRTHSFAQSIAGMTSAVVSAAATARFGAWLCRGVATSPGDCLVAAGNEHLPGGSGNVSVRGDLPSGRNTLLVYVAAFPPGASVVAYTASVTPGP